MPVATPKQYAAMLDAAQKGNYAYPAVNVTSIATINASLKHLLMQNRMELYRFLQEAVNLPLALV